MDQESRRKELAKKKMCFNCGNGYPYEKMKRHSCKFDDAIKCIAEHKPGVQCRFNGLTCSHKQIDPEVKEIVKKKLGMDLKGFNYVHIGSPEQILPSNREEDAFVLAGSRREDLQRGEVAKQMKDKELLTFFKQSERNTGGNINKILEVPKGETLANMCGSLEGILQDPRKCFRLGSSQKGCA